MNRVCLKDGKLIEMQSGGDDRPDLMEMRLNTLKQNALNAGYTEDQIEVKWVSDEEWAVIQEANKPVIPIEEQKRKAYQSEADPLWREWQVLLAANHEDAELRRQEWLAKRAEIQARYL